MSPDIQNITFKLKKQLHKYNISEKRIKVLFF